MIVSITSKCIEITPAIRHHIEERLNKLSKWRVSLINPHIVLSKEPQEFIVDANIIHRMENYLLVQNIVIFILQPMN